MLFLNELHKISETTYLNYLHSSSKFSTRSKNTNRKKIKKSGSKTPKTFKKIDKSSSVKKMRLSNQLGPKLKAHIKNIPAINTKSIEAYDVTQLILMFDLIDNISNHITTISPKDVEEFKNILFLRSFNNGIKHIVSYIKRCKVCILLITSGEIPEDINKLVGLPKTNNLGFPQRIRFLAHIMHTETGIRELISLLNTFKVLIEKIDNKELNYSSIINPHQEHAVTGIEQLVLSDKLRYVRLFLELPKFSLEDVKTNTFPIIRKAGPNGQAILICHNEIFFEDNLNKCLEFIGDAPKASLLALQETYQSNYNKLSDSDKSKFCDSRLTTFADKGFKSRTVAIVRYWSQLALDGLINKLNRNVLNNKNIIDCTFDQTKGVNLMRDAIEEGNYIHSIDLQSATDRIPALLSRAVLNTVSSNYVAELWYRISCKRKFVAKGVKHKISYAVGTPIGIKSGFSVIALTLHYLVQLSYLETRLFNIDIWKDSSPVDKIKLLKEHPKFTNYCILGDDVVIWNDSVAKYFKILLLGFGIVINETKSFSSSSVCEFASRNLVVLNNDRLNSFKLKTSNNQDKSVKGNSENMDLEVSFTSLDSENSVVDMTGLPVGLLSKLKRYPHLRIVCLVKIVERGYLINTAIQYILNFIQDNGKMSRSKLMTIKALILHSIIYDPDSELFNNKDFNLELSGLSSVQDIFSGDSNLLIQNYTYSKIFIQILSIPLRFEKMLGLLPADHNFVGQKEQAFNLPEEHPLNIANNSIIELFSNIHETNDFTSLPNDIGVPVFVELFLSASKIDAFVNTSRTEDKVRITLCHQNYLLFLKFFKNNEYLESSNSQTIELIDSFEPLIRSDSVEFESCRTLLDKTVEDLPNLLVYSQLFSRLISANNSRKSSLNKTTKLAKINAKVVVESDLDINWFNNLRKGL